MKRIIMVALISGLVGCQSAPSLTVDKLSELSNEDLCRALGTYNDDGQLVLKIYDELKKRPEKIDPERCYILETIDKEQQPVEWDPKNNGVIKNIPNYNDNPYPSPYVDPQHHRIIHTPRIDKKTDIDDLKEINSLNRSMEYRNHMSVKEKFSFKKKNITDKIDMKEKDMAELMKDCLQKHISHPHINTNTRINTVDEHR